MESVIENKIKDIKEVEMQLLQKKGFAVQMINGNDKNILKQMGRFIGPRHEKIILYFICEYNQIFQTKYFGTKKEQCYLDSLSFNNKMRNINYIFDLINTVFNCDDITVYMDLYTYSSVRYEPFKFAYEFNGDAFCDYYNRGNYSYIQEKDRDMKIIIPNAIKERRNNYMKITNFVYNIIKLRKQVCTPPIRLPLIDVSQIDNV